MLPLSPSQPGGCRVAVGRRVHMASGSPASKKRRPLEPHGWIRDSLHEPVDTDACTSFLVSHIIPSTSLLQSVEGEETGLRAVVTASGQRTVMSATARQLAVCTATSSVTSTTLAEPPPFHGMPPLVHTLCGGGRGRGIRVIPGQRFSAVSSPSLRPLCVLARAVRSTIVVGQHVEMG